LTASLVKQRMTPQRAAIAVDLAAQACDKAIEAFNRTILMAPDNNLGLCATEIAAQLAASHMGRLIAGADKLAKAHGLSRARTEVER
jgi:hypothetical protein